MVVVEELEHALARGAHIMLKSLATAQPLMVQTWLLRLRRRSTLHEDGDARR